jgi:CO dehydrogenase maturation factor
MERQVVAVCGKGGVGKTVFSALLGRILADAGVRPLLLVDADPTGDLAFALGHPSIRTLSDVRDRVTRGGWRGKATEAADELDYLILEALVETPLYSLLAVGHSSRKGCFCPANELLKLSIDVLISGFAAVVIDVEAGIEQISRDVTRRVDRVVTIVDGSQKSGHTLRLITDMVKPKSIHVVSNRLASDNNHLPDGTHLAGAIPENAAVRQFDIEGRSLWELPGRNRAVLAVRHVAKGLGLIDNERGTV